LHQPRADDNFGINNNLEDKKSKNINTTIWQIENICIFAAPKK
jgi:hypothetical protein